MFAFRYTETYEPFTYLLSPEADRFTDKFISRKKPLTDYVVQIEKLKDMASRIGSLPVLVPMHFFLLDCTVLHKVNCVPTVYTKVNILLIFHIEIQQVWERDLNGL